MRYRARKNWVKKYAGFVLVYHGPSSAKVRRWLVNCAYVVARRLEINVLNETSEIFGEPDAK